VILNRRSISSASNWGYIDILLRHCLRPPTWAKDYWQMQDGFSAPKDWAHRSVHGLQALRTFPGNQWLDIAMIRMNHNGTKMDTEALSDVEEQGQVDEVVAYTKQVYSQGMGVISMKLCGEAIERMNRVMNA
jgi:hypothetical protein